MHAIVAPMRLSHRYTTDVLPSLPSRLSAKAKRTSATPTDPMALEGLTESLWRAGEPLAHPLLELANALPQMRRAGRDGDPSTSHELRRVAVRTPCRRSEALRRL